MDIIIRAKAQRLHIATPYKTILIENKDVIKFVFACDGEWDSITKTAKFIQGNTVATQPLDDRNSCSLPDDIQTGVCIMLLSGIGSGNTASSNPVVLNITDVTSGTDIMSSGITTSEISSAVSTYMSVHPVSGKITMDVDSNGNGTFRLV